MNFVVDLIDESPGHCFSFLVRVMYVLYVSDLSEKTIISYQFFLLFIWSFVITVNFLYLFSIRQLASCIIIISDIRLLLYYWMIYSIDLLLLHQETDNLWFVPVPLLIFLSIRINKWISTSYINFHRLVELISMLCRFSNGNIWIQSTLVFQVRCQTAMKTIHLVPSHIVRR